MAILWASGFTGLKFTEPRPMSESNWSFLTNVGLIPYSKRDSANTLYPGSLGFVADSIFPTRRNLRCIHDPQSYNSFGGFRIPFGTKPDKGLCFGFTFKSVIGPSGRNIGICAGSYLADKISSSNKATGWKDVNEGLVCLGTLPPAATGSSSDFCLYTDRPSTTFVQPTGDFNRYKGGSVHHCEVQVDFDTKRVRVYINGKLEKDYVLSGSVDGLKQGISIFFWNESAVSANNTTEIGNIYAISIDDIHTGRLGPAARVVDYKPVADIVKGFINGNKEAKGNYQTASQEADSDDAYSLVAPDGGATDIYSIDPAIATDAAKIFGVSMMIRASDPTGEGHKIAPVIYKDGDTVAVNEYAASGTMQSSFVDISKNPYTSAKWDVADIIKLGIGMRGGY